MDENKEYVEMITDAEGDEGSNEIDITDLSESTDDYDDYDDYEVEQPKKSSVIQRCIIISAIIVAVFIVVTIVCSLFFNKNFLDTNVFGVSGKTVWHYSEPAASNATSDSAQTVDFTLTFDDGTLYVKLGTLESKGEYTLTHIDDKMNIKDVDSKIGEPVLIIKNSNAILNNNYLDGTYFYDVTGNVFSGKTLTLTNVNDDSVKFELDDDIPDEMKVERKGEFTKDEKLVGEWEYIDEQVVFDLVYNDDGTYTRTDINKLNNTIIKQEGIYNCKDGVVTNTYISSQENDEELQYEIKDGKFILYKYVIKNNEFYIKPYEFTKK